MKRSPANYVASCSLRAGRPSVGFTGGRRLICIRRTYLKATRTILVNKLGEFGIVLFRQSSFGCDIHDQEDVSLELGHGNSFSHDGFVDTVVETCFVGTVVCPGNCTDNTILYTAKATPEEPDRGRG